MKILSIETSTEACSAAILVGNEISEKFKVAPREHTQLILPMVKELLADAQLTISQLDAVAFSRGPGSFTGLRIAAGVVQGLCFSNDIPVIPVSTLLCLAQGAYRKLHAKNVITCLDARVHEIYWACFKENEDNIMDFVVKESCVVPKDAVVPEGEGWLVVGDGWNVYKEVLMERVGDKLKEVKTDFYPQARDLMPFARLAYKKKEFVLAEDALPVYLREMHYRK